MHAGGNTNAKRQTKEDGHAAIYEEPDILTPTSPLELEACPAYEVTKTKDYTGRVKKK